MSRIFGNSPPNGNDILISAAFSSASWRSMEAAWNCYKEFLLVSKLLLDKAPCQKVVSDLITWMSVAKKLKHSSIQSYLSSITTILKLKNVDCAAFTTYLTKTLCKGVKTIQINYYQVNPSDQFFSGIFCSCFSRPQEIELGKSSGRQDVKVGHHELFRSGPSEIVFVYESRPGPTGLG